jgi:hypothetical protein
MAFGMQIDKQEFSRYLHNSIHHTALLMPSILHINTNYLLEL